MSSPSKLSLFDKLLGAIERRKTSDRLLLRTLFFLVILAGIWFTFTKNQENSTATPTAGGSLKEGIVGIPRFVNPALALTRADQDTVALLYSGLLKIDTNGNLTPDLAENITVSEDGLSYQVNLKKNRVFHDGTPITTRDVEYTIALIQNPELKSPLAGNWSDVTVEVISEYELTITLAAAYSPFMENFTLGIMPHHIWSTLPLEQLPFSQHNTEPIGSGPFLIKEVIRDTSGLISGYTLEPQAGAKANLDTIELSFFQNETLLSEAFMAGTINATAYLPLATVAQLDESDYTIKTLPLPRIFGVFFNQNRSAALRDKAARQALNQAVDREALITQLLSGYGVPITEPMIADSNTLESMSSIEASSSFSQDNARNTLEQGKWTQNESGFWEKEIDEATEVLSVTIKTSNSDLFNTTATILAENWRKLGVEVEIEQYEQSDLVQSVIRTREFAALLFGLDMSRSKDLYPFWHSSQKNDPGLNIAQYTNISVDRLLEKSRNTQDKTERDALLAEISTAINTETPAIFLFAPSLTYVINKDITASELTELGKPSDRFMNIEAWYAKSEILWPVFQNKEINNQVN
jgi:peptide/nickel transport system substrate-binding protein